jgi:hypothetical protein
MCVIVIVECLKEEPTKKRLARKTPAAICGLRQKTPVQRLNAGDVARIEAVQKSPKSTLTPMNALKDPEHQCTNSCGRRGFVIVNLEHCPVWNHVST